MYSFKSLLTKKALPKLGLSLGKWLLCLMMLGIMDVNIHNLSAQILYQESFESGANGWTKVVGPFGRNSSWELGTPSASVINSASDGTQAWATNLDGNHNFNEQSAVLGPNIDLGSAVNPILSLDVYWETVFFQDGAFLEVSTNGTTFTRLGVDPDFYNGQAGFGGSNFVPAWTGSNSDLNGSNGWVTVSADLSAFVGQTIRLRVVFRSAQDILGTGDTGLNGFAFDNVRISNGVPSLKINAFPYAESFERSNGGWVSAPDFNFAVTNSWELQTPSGLLFFGASDGNYAWTTSSTALGGQDSYFDSELSQVLSPCFDFSALTSPQLSFDIWWETTFSLDGGALQYSTDNGATWTFVDPNFVVTDGVDGYNGIVFDDFGISDLGFIPAWTGDAANALGSDGYVPVEIDLSFLAGNPTVNFRFLFISDASEENLDGIAFDNVKIEEANVVEPLAIAAIEDITVNTDAGVCSATVTLPEAVVTGGVTPVNVSNDAPASFELGETTVTYTATDANGTSVSTSFIVTVNDRENPVFVACPQNINATAPFGAAGAVVTYDFPEASDNCSALIIVTLLEGFDSGETFPIGETTVSYIAVDDAGNSAECTFSVTVTEGQPAELSIAAIADITVSNDPGVCGATVILPEAVVTGGEGEITITNDAPEIFPVGTTTVTYTATDGAGQTVSTSFDVTVNDTETPVFTAGVDDLFLSTDAPSEIFLLDPVVSDNCPEATFELVGGLANGSVFPLGITKQTYEATDASGNKTQACYNIGLLPLVQDLPYSQDFEAGNGGFAAGTPGCAQANSWELTSSGAFLNAIGVNEQSFVISPFFLLDELSLEQPTLVVDLNFALGAGDTVTLEASIDGGFEWTELASFTGNGTETISESLSSLLSGPGVAITLFRFSVEADSTQGVVSNFFFDNFRIFDAAVAELAIAAIEDITVSNDPGVCGATVTLPEAVVTGGVAPITVTNDAPATFSVGTTT
ncbi:MAG: HYR domain-containing protein, partial [Microscillaceae bacterium]|nr:HYR domain-containing protein [Microscillaceae bacterium]